jgi:hypothetical protein
VEIRLSSRAFLTSTMLVALLAGAATAQDQFKIGQSSVGRSREDGASRSSQRNNEPARSAARTPARDNNARTLSASRPDRSRADNARGSSSRDNDRSGPRSAIDPDGDGVGLSYRNTSIWEPDALNRAMPDRGGRDDRGDDRRGNDRHDNDWRDDRHDNRYGSRGRDNHTNRWDDDCDDDDWWDRSSLHISIGTGWSDCDDVGFGYRSRSCSTPACGGCASCLPYSYGAASVTTYGGAWQDPWDVAYVAEPVVITQPVIVTPAPVVTVPVIVYASSDVADAILAADAGAHQRAVSLLRAYAAQHGRLPHYSELGPASRQALDNVRRVYERAALEPGANADTYFMLGACRAMRGDRDLAAVAFDAALARGDADPSCAALRSWVSS